jgi:undecaprenyl-phosphate 4-deoxy-4-formamido-L-arabinose transferase
MLSVGIAGEYVGRIYQEVRRRPRFVIRTVYEGEPGGTPPPVPWQDATPEKEPSPAWSEERRHAVY